MGTFSDEMHLSFTYIVNTLELLSGIEVLTKEMCIVIFSVAWVQM